MSVATEITRIQTARNTIRDKMVDLGLGEQTDKIDALAGEVNSIQNRGAVAGTLDVGNTSYTVPAGYHNGSGSVSIVTEAKSVSPTRSVQEIIPTSGTVLSKVTVDKIPDILQSLLLLSCHKFRSLILFFQFKCIIAHITDLLISIMKRSLF